MRPIDADLLLERVADLIFQAPATDRGEAYNNAIVTCQSLIGSSATIIGEVGTCEYRRSSAMCRRADGSWRDSSDVRPICSHR